MKTEEPTMTQNNPKKRNAFRKLEQMLTRVILGTVVVFVLMLVASANGIGWLKWLLALPVLIVSVVGGGMLILKQEHKRRRSWWMLASFAGLLLCTLVSLIVRFPAP